MTFSYDGTLPNPPHDPADDVDQMQTNSASISSIIAVDHTGFNVASGGTHKQVTFASNNPPSVPTAPPVLFTNTQDGATVPNTLPGGIPGLFFYSGSSTQGERNNIVATSGSVVLFGGIILKWGQANFTTTATSLAITYASTGSNSFPNNSFAPFAMAFTSTGQAANEVTVSVHTTAGMTVNRAGGSGIVSGMTVYYFCIGN